MMAATAREYSVPDFLEAAGARLRGYNRADCQRCGGRRTVSLGGEVFCCHHAGCDFRGNTFTLEKALGLARRLPKAEWPAEKRARDQPRRSAEGIAQRVNDRRRLLAEAERTLHKTLAAVSAAGDENPDNFAAWSVLPPAYSELPKVRAEWTFLSYGPAVAVVEFLASSPEAQEKSLGAVIAQGGVYDDAGRFVACL